MLVERPGKAPQVPSGFHEGDEAALELRDGGPEARVLLRVVKARAPKSGRGPMERAGRTCGWREYLVSSCDISIHG